MKQGFADDDWKGSFVYKSVGSWNFMTAAGKGRMKQWRGWWLCFMEVRHSPIRGFYIKCLQTDAAGSLSIQTSVFTFSSQKKSVLCEIYLLSNLGLFPITDKPKRLTGRNSFPTHPSWKCCRVSLVFAAKAHSHLCEDFAAVPPPSPQAVLFYCWQGCHV